MIASLPFLVVGRGVARCLLPARRGAVMRDLRLGKWLVVANLLVFLVAAWFMARAVSTLSDAFLRPAPHLTLAGAPAARGVSAVAALEEGGLWRLIGLEPSAASGPSGPGVTTRGPSCDDPGASPIRSGLRLSLVGAVLADGPRSFVVTIADTGTGQSRTVTSGDRIGEAEVLALQRLAMEGDLTGNGFRLVAILCNAGTLEYLDDDQGSAAASPPGRADGDDGIRSLGSDRYEVERSVVERVLSDPRQLGALRVVPWIENEAIAGFRVFSVQPGSLISSIGLANGDIVRRVNGYQLDSLETALELLQKLRRSSRVTIDIEHDARPMRKEILLSGG